MASGALRLRGIGSVVKEIDIHGENAVWESAGTGPYGAELPAIPTKLLTFPSALDTPRIKSAQWF